MTNSTELNETSNESKNSDPNLQIDDLTAFVSILTRWHQVKVHELNHLLTIPDESHIGVILEENGETKEHVMQGEMLEGFKAGIKVALTALGQLPFTYVLEDGPTNPMTEAAENQPN